MNPETQQIIDALAHGESVKLATGLTAYKCARKDEIRYTLKSTRLPNGKSSVTFTDYDAAMEMLNSLRPPIPQASRKANEAAQPVTDGDIEEAIALINEADDGSGDVAEGPPDVRTMAIDLLEELSLRVCDMYRDGFDECAEADDKLNAAIKQWLRESTTPHPHDIA